MRVSSCEHDLAHRRLRDVIGLRAYREQRRWRTTSQNIEAAQMHADIVPVKILISENMLY